MKASTTLKKLWDESGWEGGQGQGSEATKALEDLWEYVIPVIAAAEEINKASAIGQPGSLISNLRISLHRLGNKLRESE